jgi:hypothetical protein
VTVCPFSLRPGRSSAWPERLLWEQEVVGSNPITPIFINIEYISTCPSVIIYLTSQKWCEIGFVLALIGFNWL